MHSFSSKVTLFCYYYIPKLLNNSQDNVQFMMEQSGPDGMSLPDLSLTLQHAVLRLSTQNFHAIFLSFEALSCKYKHVYGQIPRDGLTSKIYFFKYLWAFDMLFHVSSEVIYAKL